MEWGSSWAFLLLPIPFFVAGFYYWSRKNKKASLRFSDLSRLQSVAKGWRVRLADAPTWLKIAALIFFVLALARPQESNTKVRRNVEGIDIMIALDISDSMLIEDAPPEENRLEAAKKTISEFIAGRVSDRIGLVVFSGEAYTRVPLTLDYTLLQDNLKKVKTSRNIKMGTAIGVALANAVGRLRESTSKSQVIIFLTDGENNSGTIDPETALDLAKEYGFKIYSIGMGRDGQAQLPQLIPDGRGNMIKQYRPMHSKINEPLLRRFADETGGQFWRAESGTDLDEVFLEINKLEKTKIAESKFTRYSEKFQKYLWVGLILYLLAMISAQTWLRRTV